MTLAQPPDRTVSTGLRVTGHFGELMQGRLGPRGPVALISLPCPALWVELPARTGDCGLIDARRAGLLLSALGRAPAPALPPLRATMPQGGGAGSSTAALVALARAQGFDGPPEALARACVAAEGASDPLMFPRAERLLFAPRQGRVLRRLPVLPAFEVIGGFWGAGQRTDPQDIDFPDIADLVAAWPGDGGVASMAALVAESARRTLAHRGLSADPTAALAKALGARGWMIAHTGSARGLIFAPGEVPPEAASRLREAGFAGVLRFAAGGAA